MRETLFPTITLDNNELRSDVSLNIEGESCEIKYRRRVNYAQLRVQQIDIFLSHFPYADQSAKKTLARTKLVTARLKHDILTLAIDIRNLRFDISSSFVIFQYI